MLTQCPGCHTSFHVTGAILRAAHGQVRCGHCNSQFDAIEHLIDGDMPVGTESGDPTVTAPGRVAPTMKEIIVEEPFAEEITLEGSRIEISGTYRTMTDSEHSHTQTIVQEFNAGDEAESVSAGPAGNDADEIVADDLTRELHMESVADPRAADAAVETPAATQSVRPAAPERMITERPRNRPATDTEDFGTAARAHGGRGWPTLSLLMLLALMAQIVNHYRQDLARRADVGPYLTQLYALLGLPLEPRWDLAAYAVKQWGVISDPNTGGTLRVRASIANNAAFAQPYPLLKLTLEDRFGAQVGTREFKPEEYLASASRATRLLEPGQSVNADIAIVDPGEEAVGFHLNVCLSRADGSQCTG